MLDDLMIWSRESNTFGWQSNLGDLYGVGASRLASQVPLS